MQILRTADLPPECMEMHAPLELHAAAVGMKAHAKQMELL